MNRLGSAVPQSQRKVWKYKYLFPHHSLLRWRNKL